MFRFHAPAYDSFFTDSLRYDNQANRSFMARLYWSGNQTRQVAFIFNGLDETIFSSPDPFAFYDQLGESLASEDFLAILLPTPYHLNRVMAFTENEANLRNSATSAFPDYTKPSLALMRSNSSIYRNHFQGFRETLGLYRELLPNTQPAAFKEIPRVECLSPAVRAFFRDCIEEPARVSLIGYSLGGLRALTEYFRDRYESTKVANRRPLFSCCVAINSGGALSTLPNPDWVEKDQWTKMIDELLCQRHEGSVERYNGLSSDEREAASRHYAFLDDIFLGQAVSLNTLSKIDNQVSRRVLFILGGDDQLVPPSSLARLAPTGGLNIFQIAGMGHMLSYDEAWKHWKPVVFDVIKQFLRTVAKRSASVHGLTEMVALLDHRLRLFPYRLDKGQSETIQSALERIRIEDSLAVQVLGEKESMELASRFEGSLSKLDVAFRNYCESLLLRLQNLALLGQGGDLRIYRKIRRKFLLGAYLTNSNKDLQDAWEVLVNEHSGKKLGQILTDLKVVPKATLDQALERQTRDIMVLQRRMAADIVQSMRRSRSV
jgi:pimeloyl-ACP methyl ester carboxylesterase